jgi:hypothetical protein
MPRYSFGDWVAEQLRLTVFPLPNVGNLPAERWWEAIVGAPAEESTANSRIGTRTLAGTFQEAKLLLKLEPGRIDWLFLPRDPDPGASPSGEFPSIGPITENLERFSGIAEQWLGRDDIPDVARIAFGAVVRHPEPDRRSAYVRLPDYVPIRVDPEASDFNFQLNIPTRSRTGIDGLQINRLSKWSVAALARVGLIIEGVRLSTTSTQFVDYALRLELDINTSPEFQGPVPRARLIDVFRELAAFGRSIITEGLPQ